MTTTDAATPLQVAGLYDPAMREALDLLTPELRVVAQYHYGWRTADGSPVDLPRGKLLRPALVLTTAQALGGSARSAVPGAIAVDLVHNQSLVHDDLIDEDTERRHRPAVWAAFGAGDAILSGDALLTLGFQVLLDTPEATRACAVLAGGFQYMLRGQMLDTAFERRALVTTDEYVEMAAAKTGSLFGCAAALGAVHCDAEQSTVDALETFGRHLGVSFQLVDDILGIWGDRSAVGKPVGGGILRRKKSGRRRSGRGMPGRGPAARPLRPPRPLHGGRSASRRRDDRGRGWPRLGRTSRSRTPR